MSKRYREVLQDVETRHSRRAQAAAGSVPAGPTDRTGDEAAFATRPGAAEVPTNRAADATTDVAVGVGAAGVAAGVATLVRPAAPSAAPRPASPAPAVAPATTRGASGIPPVGPSSTRRPDHPGNGPADADEPLVFAWRGRRYDVTRILGHWREEEGWWRRPDGEPIRIEQSDLWRVEAVRGGGMARDQRGVYELSCRGVVWRLDRVWD